MIEDSPASANANGIQKITYAGILKKIDDTPDLRIELETIFHRKTHKELVRYCLLLGKHILELSNMEPCGAIQESFAVNTKWLHGETGNGFARFQGARNAAGTLLKLARDEKDPVKEKVYRVMAQIANSPHIKNHALWASDYAVKLINTLYPHNMDAVQKEREAQIALMRSV